MDTPSSFGRAAIGGQCSVARLSRATQPPLCHIPLCPCAPVAPFSPAAISRKQNVVPSGPNGPFCLTYSAPHSPHAPPPTRLNEICRQVAAARCSLSLRLRAKHSSLSSASSTSLFVVHQLFSMPAAGEQRNNLLTHDPPLPPRRTHHNNGS